MSDKNTFSVSEIFRSIQGETSYAGLPCTFVRLAGCNLKCPWCDTGYAQDAADGTPMNAEDAARRAAEHGTRLVCITGGEPLLQGPAVSKLAGLLLRAGHTVLLETNGTQDLSAVPGAVVTIMDVKCPSAGHPEAEPLPGNLSWLRETDELKFVVADRADFDWAVSYLYDNALDAAPGVDGPRLLMGAAGGRLDAAELAEWILESGLEVRLQLQIHKTLWPDRDRGV
jgi:7-carboxy-7-deazaguanine synthase